MTQAERLLQELSRAYAEIRKQVTGSGVVFDREICDHAMMNGEHDNSASNWWGFNPHG